MSKIKLVIISLFLFGSFQFVQAQQRTAKKAPLFASLQSPEYDGVVVWCKEFNVASFSSGNIVSLSANKRKEMKAPANVKRLTGSIQMKCENRCLEIFPDIDIILLWHDANNDGKLNPKTELKYYKESGKPRGIVKGKQLKCN
ncbi:MAG: hypothetical protein AAGD28_15965 [Bacteroidota bacterium]